MKSRDVYPTTTPKKVVLPPPLLPLEGFKFGCDPELFVFDHRGRPVTAAGLLPGTKESPFPVVNGGVQVDGMAAEFTIDPASTFEEWDRNISSVIHQMGKMLPTGHTLKAIPSLSFMSKEWDAAPEEAKVMGCSSDFNAWTGEVNQPPQCLENPRLRCGGGHVHIGWTEDADTGDTQHLMNCRDLVKQLDWYLGGWSLRMDKDVNRRRLYGNAGAMRPKSYGVEYRVLSNFWVMEKGQRLAVWNRMQQAIFDMSKNYRPDAVSGSHNALLRSCINSSDPSSMLEKNYPYPLVTIDRSVGGMY